MPKSFPQRQQALHVDSLRVFLENHFQNFPEHRASNARFPLSHILKAAFALFSLTAPSLLDFKKQTLPQQNNLRSIHRLHDDIPCANQMRVALDPLAPTLLRSLCAPLFHLWQKAGLPDMNKKQPDTMPCQEDSCHKESVLTVAWSPNGDRLASGSDDNTVKVWDMHTQQLLQTSPSLPNSVNAVAWSPDGKLLASAGQDGAVKLWNASTYEELYLVGNHEKPVKAVAWSPDGTLLAFAGEDRTVKLWDVKARQPLLPLEDYKDAPAIPKNEEEGINALAWSPDGTLLASTSWYGAVNLWEAKTWRIRLALRANSEPTRAVAWSPDGKRLATGSDDNTVRVWDTETGQALLTLNEEEERSVFSVAWSRDGSRFAAGCDDNRVYVWAAPK